MNGFLKGFPLNQPQKEVDLEKLACETMILVTTLDLGLMVPGDRHDGRYIDGGNPVTPLSGGGLSMDTNNLGSL